MKKLFTILLLTACAAFGQAPQQLHSVKVPQVFTYSTGKPVYQDIYVNPTGAAGVWGFGTNYIPVFWLLGTNLSVTNGTLNASGGGGGGSPGGSTTQLQYNNSESFGGITGATTNGTFVVLTSPTITTKISPTTDDGAPLGDTTHNWSDLFMASGGVINFANSNWVATHTSGILTVGTGDLRVTTAGTNSASVVTVGGAQTLTGKSIAASQITGQLAVANGGTGLSGGTSGGVLAYTASGTLASSAALTSTAIVAGGGAGAAPSTPSATTTLDGSGNISTPGSITTGAGGSAAGFVGLGQGTAPSTGTTNIKIAAPASVTSYIRLLPGAVGSTGFLLETVSGTTQTESLVASNGSGNVLLSAGTAAIASGKTLTVSNALTLAGTDSTTMTFPTTNATVARTDAAQTFTGIQTFSSAPVASANSLTNLPHSVTFSVDGAGTALTTGVQIPVKVPFGGTLTGYTMMASPSGSITFNVFRAANSAGLPTASIINNAGGGGGTGTLPAIASGVEGSSTTFTNWGSTTITALDNLALNLTTVDSTVTKVTFVLYYK